MADIIHRVGIKAPISKVYAALSTVEGVAGWWTKADFWRIQNWRNDWRSFPFCGWKRNRQHEHGSHSARSQQESALAVYIWARRVGGH